MPPITLGSNIAALQTQRRLGEATSALSRTSERLSSGLRINRAADDAAGLSISQALKSDARVFNQGIRNLNDGLSLLAIADSSLSELSNITVRLVELAEQAANGTYSSVQRKALDTEAQALKKEFFRLSRSTSFNNISLLDGSVSTLRFQSGYGSNGGILSDLGGALGDGSFRSGSPIAFGTQQFSTAAADFNGDGILDFAAVTTYLNSASVLLGNGDGSFVPKSFFPTGGFPNAIATADFNSDGIMDLVTADLTSNTVTVATGVGDGTFTRQSLATGANPLNLTTGDFNGDGFVDIATADQSTGVSVLYNRGNGSFSPQQFIDTVGEPYYITSGDLNNDGVPDVVTGNFANGTVSVLMGSRGAGLGSENVITVSAGVFEIIPTLGDFNNDGFLDLAAVDTDAAQITLRVGQGNGTFGAAQTLLAIGSETAIAAADVNGDGNLDLVTADGGGSGGLGVHIGRGNGAFDARVGYGSGLLQSLSIADFNGDGVLDVLAAGNSSNAQFFAGNTRSGVSPILDFSLATIAGARQALPMLKRKQEQISTQRGKIGAVEARISSALNNAGTTRENIMSAESRISDADIAEESAYLVRDRIVQQAAASVLAQANLQPALALTLIADV